MTPKRTYTFYAKEESQKQTWIEKFTGVIEKLVTEDRSLIRAFAFLLSLCVAFRISLPRLHFCLTLTLTFVSRAGERGPARVEAAGKSGGIFSIFTVSTAKFDPLQLVVQPPQRVACFVSVAEATSGVIAGPESPPLAARAKLVSPPPLSVPAAAAAVPIPVLGVSAAAAAAASVDSGGGLDASLSPRFVVHP